MDILKNRAKECSRIICSTFRDESRITDLLLLELKGEGKCISDLIKSLNKLKKKNDEISKVAKKADKQIKKIEEEAAAQIAEIISPSKSEAASD